jgi:hypothetical protein
MDDKKEHEAVLEQSALERAALAVDATACIGDFGINNCDEVVTAVIEALRQPQTDALKIAREALEPVGWVYTDREGETSLHGSRLENGPKLGWTEARLYILKEQSK